MKYRIILKEDTYYPQYRGWFRWKYFHREINHYSGYIFKITEGYRDQEDAIDFIDNQQNPEDKGFKVVWHSDDDKLLHRDLD